ncbi:hypothetical protein PCK1_002403 [Pneumocystis canis]|nr:hypothetical protein PCK1_002403 [Pneumocystis canis]
MGGAKPMETPRELSIDPPLVLQCSFRGPVVGPSHCLLHRLSFLYAHHPHLALLAVLYAPCSELPSHSLSLGGFGCGETLNEMSERWKRSSLFRGNSRFIARDAVNRVNKDGDIEMMDDVSGSRERFVPYQTQHRVKKPLKDRFQDTETTDIMITGYEGGTQEGLIAFISRKSRILITNLRYDGSTLYASVPSGSNIRALLRLSGSRFAGKNNFNKMSFNQSFMMFQVFKRLSVLTIPRCAYRVYSTGTSPSSKKGLYGGFIIGAVLLGGGYYYYKNGMESFQCLIPRKPVQKDYHKVYKEIAELLNSDEVEDYDDGSLGPILVRLGWHSSGTYNKENKNKFIKITKSDYLK